MKNYIHQLLGDLDVIMSTHQSSVNTLELFAYEEESVDDCLELSKLQVAPECSFADILGLDQNVLPPENKLDDQLVSELFDSLSDALMVYRCYLDFPVNISNREKYNILRNYWNEPQMICNGSVNTIDFCDYDQDNCLYGSKNCQCKNFEEQG